MVNPTSMFQIFMYYQMFIEQHLLVYQSTNKLFEIEYLLSVKHITLFSDLICMKSIIMLNIFCLESH